MRASLAETSWASLILIGMLGLTALPAAGAATPKASELPAPSGRSNLDVRVGHQGELGKVLAGNRVDTPATVKRATVQLQAVKQGVARLAAASPGAEVRFSPLFGAAEVVRNPRGALTGPAPGRSGKDIVLDFLGANRGLYGLSDADLSALQWKGESLDRKSGLRMVRFEQVVSGLPVFQSETRVTLDRNGRIIRTVGLLAPSAATNTFAPASRLTAQQAFATAMASVGIRVDAAKMSLRNASPDGARVEIATGDPQIRGDAASHLVYFPAGPGILVPAWQQVTFTRGPGDWITVVDAGSGTLLWRKNMRSQASTQEARFNVYLHADGKTPGESPAPHSPTDVTPGSGTQFPAVPRVTVNMSTVQDINASPDGWISDGGNTTTGNNTDAYLDTDGDNMPDPGALDDNGRPIGNIDGAGHPRDFLGTGYDYTPPPLGSDPDAGTDPTDPQSQRGSVTQAFYVANWYHDRLYNLGFDEAAGNYQTDNFGRGGTGGDPLLAEVQSTTFGNNAGTFTSPPDGMSGLLQVSTFTWGTPNRDGNLEGSIVLHELTHGVSGRLIGNGFGLLFDEGGGMGEGWSDFYAQSLLSSTNAYPPTAKYVQQPWTTYNYRNLQEDNYLYGIRRFPYCSDKTVNPLTFADVDDLTLDLSGGIPPSILKFTRFGADEVHNAGEVWANTLWDVRSRVIADPAGANGDVPTGNDTMLALVTDAMKMTPLNPSFPDARDAILDADCATHACANEKSIWGGFANRGLGYKAVAPLAQDGLAFLSGVSSYLGVGESFAVPYLDVAALTVDDSLGNHNGAIDPGEPIRLTVELKNPWRAASQGVAGATATLTSSTPGVTLLTGSAAYPAIAAQGTAAGTPFLFTVSPSALCGQSLHFTLTTVSSLGTTSVDFTLRVGAVSGTGAPITYTRTIPGGLAIPDGQARGVGDSMTITDDREISSLVFDVNDLQHEATSDLIVGFKAPSGYGTTLIYLRGIFTSDSSGANFIDTKIDGSSTNDLNATGGAAAPYTGSWAPAFNSASISTLGFPTVGPDPVDQLSYVKGLSTSGTWSIYVADEFAGNTGQLNTWSLIVTPTAFTCNAFTPTAAVSGTKTVAGNFVAGGAITYTVTLSNTGSAAQADNPGNEFTDVLPSTLTLVSATSTSGIATADVATNTVTWNGVLPAVVGQATITIEATIKSTAAGQSIANQGQIAFDADGDGINESSAVTDDPATATRGDATALVVPPAITDVPTLSPLGFATLALLLLGAGFALLRRRRTT